MELNTVEEGIENEEEDYISELPDSILVHILSFLPLGDAINTVLLKRFGNLWRYISVLDLDYCLHHDCEAFDYDKYEDEGIYQNEKFVDLVNNVVNLHNIELEKLRLLVEFELRYSKDEGLSYDYRDYVDKEKRTSEQIEKLISYGIRRKVKVLDLDFSGCNSIDSLLSYNVPDVFKSNYLTDLRLVSCDVKSWCNIYLESLKVLLLQDVSLNDETIKIILLGCPSVEDLSLVNCHGLKKLNCRNPNLKKMLLTLGTEGNQLQISCPFVLMLDIAGWIEYADLVNVSSVVDASICFSMNFKCALRGYVEVHRLLHKFSKCKTFSPCRWTILVFTIWNFQNVPCLKFRWKNLNFKLSLTKWHQPGISFLLKSSPSVETLTMFIYPSWADDRFFRYPVSEWIQEYDFDGENYWESQNATFPYLKSIMINGYINAQYVIKMVKFLLRSAVSLEKMVISTKENQFTLEQLHELSNELLTLPRSSPKAVIYFS